MHVKALRVLRDQIEEARAGGLLLSLHLKRP